MERILMKRNMHLKAQTFKTITIWALLVLILVSLNPDKLPVFLLVVPFILFFLGVFNLWLLLLSGWNRWQKDRAIPNASSYKRTGIAVAFLFTVVITLQSIGQLTVRDVLTLVILFATSYLYLVRMLSKS